MAFEIKATVGQLKDSIRFDCGSAVQADICFSKAGVDELIISDDEGCKVETGKVEKLAQNEPLMFLFRHGCNLWQFKKDARAKYFVSYLEVCSCPLPLGLNLSLIYSGIELVRCLVFTFLPTPMVFNKRVTVSGC